MKTDFCKIAGERGELGKYGIRLGEKALRALAARDIELFVINRVNWVEDSIRLVIGQLLYAGEAGPDGEPMTVGNASDYFYNSYPDSFAEHCRKTATDDTRRPLKYRLKFLLRCMSRTSEHYEEFEQSAIAHLRMALDTLVECVRQSAGEVPAKKLARWSNRFYRLWDATGDAVSSKAAVVREIDCLGAELDDVFETIREAYKAREQQEAREAAKEERRDEQLERLAAAQEANARVTRASVRMSERLAAEKSAAEPEDQYSQMAGLERLKGARLEEVKACIRYSHEKNFRVVRGDKSGAHSLKRLAELVWAANREKYEGWAKLKEEPGYQDVRSLAGKLYKLAQRHPQAAHFVWA